MGVAETYSEVKSKMKNKKSAMTIELIITMAILGILLLVVVGGGIKSIFIDRQLASTHAQTEQLTLDCDGDQVIGLNDQCPCVSSIRKLELGKFCGEPQPQATTNCPYLCKKR
jgi:hypothetical protein